MPKEWTHWILAGQAADKLGPGPARHAIKTHPGLYLLGAVAPDTPMYALRQAGEMDRVSHHLHGRWGEDGFTGPRRVLENFTRDPAALALALGIASHVMSDVIFHPLVMYFSGNCHEEDPGLRVRFQARHRLIETYMDLYFAHLYPGQFPCSVFGVWKEAQREAPGLMSMLGCLYFGKPGSGQRPIRSCLAGHALFHRIFRASILRGPVRGLNRVSRGKLDAMVPLFYPPRASGRELFGKSLDYRHPVTGLTRRASMKDLEMRCVASTRRLFELVEKNMEPGDPGRFFQRAHGPSLETGLKGKGAEDMRFFGAHLPLSPVLGVRLPEDERW